MSLPTTSMHIQEAYNIASMQNSKIYGSFMVVRRT